MVLPIKIANDLVIVLVVALAARIFLDFARCNPMVGKLPGIDLKADDFISMPARDLLMFLITILIGLLAPKVWNERQLPVWFDIVAAVVVGCAAFSLLPMWVRQRW